MKRPYTLGLYEKSMPSQLGWKEKLEAAKGAGFDFVEISIDETEEKLGRLDMSEEERLGLVSLMKEAGLPIRTMCLSGHRKFPLGSSDPAVRSRGMEIMEKAIRLADDLGIRIIGDIPIYVAFDGADSWSHPELFQFDADNMPVAVAGCPPDGFSAT